MPDDDDATFITTGNPFEVMDAAADTEVSRMVGYFNEDQAQVVFTLFRSIDTMFEVAANLAKLAVSDGGNREVPNDDHELNHIKSVFLSYISIHLLEAVREWYRVAGEPDLCDNFGMAHVVMPHIGLDDRDGGGDDD